jgi:hypothetical protein
MYHPAGKKIETVPDNGLTDTGNMTLDFAGIQQGADLDADGIVNLSDFKVIGQMWMSQAAWRNN